MRLAARRVPMLVVGLLSMACGTWLGLVRLGWNLPLPWQDQLIAHGPLMVCGFLGTLISLERAVALGSRWGYAAPVLVGAGALMLDLGPLGAFGPMLITAGSLVMIAIFVVVWRRHASLFVATMTMGALAWTAGNVLWLGGAPMFRVVFWWLAFLVLTIAGERLELNRVLRPTRAVRWAFVLAMLTVVGGVAAATWWPEPGVRTLVGLLALTLTGSSASCYCAPGCFGHAAVARRGIRMTLDRRTFLKVDGLAALATGAPTCRRSSDQPAGPADYRLRIGAGLAELAPDRIIATTRISQQKPCPGVQPL